MLASGSIYGTTMGRTIRSFVRQGSRAILCTSCFPDALGAGSRKKYAASTTMGPRPTHPIIDRVDRPKMFVDTVYTKEPISAADPEPDVYPPKAYLEASE